MEPIINVEETPDKVVGRRRGVRDTLALEGNRKKDAIDWNRVFPIRSIPKGVYRFKTHEEADEWLWRMIARRRKG